jgi:hypothetical protein
MLDRWDRGEVIDSALVRMLERRARANPFRRHARELARLLGRLADAMERGDDPTGIIVALRSLTDQVTAPADSFWRQQ